MVKAMFPNTQNSPRGFPIRVPERLESRMAGRENTANLSWLSGGFTEM